MTPGDFKPLWVVDFPCWNGTRNAALLRHAPPFHLSEKEDVARMLGGDHETMKALRADACYDLVINGSRSAAVPFVSTTALCRSGTSNCSASRRKSGRRSSASSWAFEYGAPPHGGIAFGFDRLCAVMNYQNPSATSSPSPKTTWAGYDDRRAFACSPGTVMMSCI